MMTAPQKEAMDDVIAEYANDFPPEIASQRIEQFRRLQGSAFFAWSGPSNPARSIIIVFKRRNSCSSTYFVNSSRE